jgi:hypothetical protein
LLSTEAEIRGKLHKLRESSILDSLNTLEQTEKLEALAQCLKSLDTQQQEQLKKLLD